MDPFDEILVIQIAKGYGVVSTNILKDWINSQNEGCGVRSRI